MSDVLNALQLGERPQGRTLLTASWVVGHKDGSHRLLKNGEVVFENGEIVFVGHEFPGEVARRIDFGNALVSPGLIDLDALSDLDTTILGIDHHPGWAKGRVWPRSYVEAGPYEMYSPEELAFQKRFAFGQLLLNGITTAAPIASLFYREWGDRGGIRGGRRCRRGTWFARLSQPRLPFRRHGAGRTGPHGACF